MSLFYQIINSPIGDICIATDGQFLRIVTPVTGWNRAKKKFDNIIEKTNPLLDLTHLQLDEYFAKKRKEFDIPLLLEGTPFQKSVWNALLKIPYGQTICYAQQADNIGNPYALRAVGGANGKNPISIIVPCHRVIGKSGKLTGYASGLDTKSYLLNLENSAKICLKSDIIS
ncbi:MAG: methylated-DNA--[protein]-cysteine S-methyltransferase [Epsilonproteobacteria bacterium]|nr:methylated-DNA--[protein]-cysteine S-methyltransferase [Campylobacterota bacterium]